MLAPEFRSLGRFVCFRPAFLTQCSPATSQVLSREPLADPGLAVTRALSGGAGRAEQGRATQSRAKEGRQSRRSKGFSCVIAALGWPYPNRPIGGQRSLFELNPKLATSCAGMAARARPRWRADLRALARRTKFCPRASVPAGPSDFESVFGLALHRRYLWRQLQLV